MRTCTFIVAMLMLTACGQKGPLYLPEDEQTKVTAATGSTNSADENPSKTAATPANPKR